MTRITRFAALALLGWMLSASAARAERGNNEVRFDLGFGSQIGMAGLTYTRAIASVFEIELGTGYGMTGPQLGAMAKVSLGSETHRLVLGVGPSVGLGNSNRTDGVAVGWLNSEVGYHLRAKGGFTFFLGFGATVALSGQLNTCDFECSFEDVRFRPASGSVYPAARIGFGYRF